MYYCSTNTTFFGVNLKVTHSPKVTADKFEGNGVARQAIGHSAIFKCQVEAAPVPMISWFHVADLNESTASPLLSTIREIHSGEQYHISIGAYKDGYVESSLTIPKVRAADFGQFICRAENSLGKEEVRIRLAESKKPTDFRKQVLQQKADSSSAISIIQRISMVFATAFIPVFLQSVFQPL
jgi:neurotrimin